MCLTSWLRDDIPTEHMVCDVSSATSSSFFPYLWIVSISFTMFLIAVRLQISLIGDLGSDGRYGRCLCHGVPLCGI